MYCYRNDIIAAVYMYRDNNINIHAPPVKHNTTYVCLIIII